MFSGLVLVKVDLLAFVVLIALLTLYLLPILLFSYKLLRRRLSLCSPCLPVPCVAPVVLLESVLLLTTSCLYNYFASVCGYVAELCFSFVFL